MRAWKTLVTICAISTCLSACGRSNRQAEWRMPSTESFIIHSAVAQRDFEIMVALPRGYAESDAKYPVLYVLDANGMFPIAVETARFLAFDRLKEEPVIVGIGYPVGGLFAVYVLFHQPELFESYLIGAPGLDWDHDVVWKFEQEFAQAHKDLQARVFLTVGLLDERNVPNVQKLDELFRSRKYGNLVWHTQFFPEETHNSAIALSLTRGIRWLYGDMAPGW